MTEIYVPAPADRYELCQPIDPADFETINIQIDGTPRRTTWRPLQMRLVHEDEGKVLLASDSPWLGSHALIFRQLATEKLGRVLEPHGELLPLDCSEAALSLFNATQVVDALDEHASSVMRFSNGKIMHITRYMFRDAAIGPNHIFKIPNLRVSPTFVTKQVAKMWRSAGLRGLEFTKVWSD